MGDAPYKNTRSSSSASQGGETPKGRHIESPPNLNDIVSLKVRVSYILRKEKLV